MFVISNRSSVAWRPTSAYQCDGSETKRDVRERVFLSVTVSSEDTKRGETKTSLSSSEEWTLCVEGSARLEEPPRCGLTLASAALCTPRGLFLTLGCFCCNIHHTNTWSCALVVILILRGSVWILQGLQLTHFHYRLNQLVYKMSQNGKVKCFVLFTVIDD